MDNPKVSVIIPVYNTAKYLPECLDSVINQTLKDIEIICVDDGSEDSSLEILNQYAQKDTRIKILTQQHKKQGAARNLGMSVAKGEYIGFVDSDDWCEPDMYEKMYNKAIVTDSDITMCAMATYNENNNEYSKTDKYSNLSVFPENFFENFFRPTETFDFFFDICVGPPNKIFKKEFFNKNNLRFPENFYFEDIIFFYDYWVKAQKISLIKDFSYNYRMYSDTSTCFSNDFYIFDYFKAFRKGKNILKKNKIYNKLKKDFLVYKKKLITNGLNQIKNRKIKLLYFMLMFFNIPDSACNNILIKLIRLLFYRFVFTDIFETIYKQKLRHSFNEFANHTVGKETILVTEAIYSHAEVIPGLVKYCLDLGYNVDILITDDNFAEKPLEMFKNNKKVKSFHLGITQYKQALQTKIIDKYKYVIFSSSRVYYDYDLYKERFIFDFVKNTIPPKKIILMEHHLDLLEDENKQKYKMIALPEFCINNGLKMVNSHYFGVDKIHSKSKITKFITTGGIEKERKNHELLISAVEELLAKNIHNFEVLVVGHGTLNITNPSVKSKIKHLGRVSYKELYKYVNDSDYILPLLDPDNPKHDRYIKDGTSGTFQLCYGFLKPMVINEHFAFPHGFSDKNAILYTGNNLAEKMEYAIRQDKNEYTKLVNNIKIKEQDIYKKSLENMESYIGRAKK